MLLFGPREKPLHVGLGQKRRPCIEPLAQLVFAIAAVQLSVTQVAEHQPTAAELGAAKVPPVPAPTVNTFGDKMMKSQRLFASA